MPVWRKENSSSCGTRTLYLRVSRLSPFLRASLYWHARYLLVSFLLALRRICLHFKLVSAKSAPNFFIDRPYGRLGNNIQQVLVALAHAQAYSGSVSISRIMARQLDAVYASVQALPRFIDEDKILSINEQITSDFFHWSNHSITRHHSYTPLRTGCMPRRSSLLGERHLLGSIQQVASECRPAFQCLTSSSRLPSSLEKECADPATLVLHLRAGDIADLTRSEYATNPLSYYECLSKMFSRLILVTQPGPEHVLLPSIVKLFPTVHMVSGDYLDDFTLLANASTLATSGVGTFPIAAALLSDRLKTLYTTDIFLREHLNPLFVRKQAEVRMLRLPGFFRQWKSSVNRELLLHRYRPPTCRFTRL